MAARSRSKTRIPVVEDEVKAIIKPPPSEEDDCICEHGTPGFSPSAKTPRSNSGVEEELCTARVGRTYFSRLTYKYHLPESQRRSSVKRKDFDNIRTQLRREGRLFVDSAFPPNNYSITYNGITHKDYKWKRPHDICRDPHFFVEGATRFDIQQGEIGDCWLLAAVSTLTLNPQLFHIVVPIDQGMTYKYAGIFHFRFWQYGKWVEVIIDDLLPTYRGRLAFMHSRTRNEFWCALLEKAYAKLYGCYEALKGGNINESMVDLTGGVVEVVDLAQEHRNLYLKMDRACRRGALMGCAIEPLDPNAPLEGRLSNGLIMKHAYSVTKVTKVPYFGRDVALVRLHNPWGNEAEWMGPWSDRSDQWRSLSFFEKLRLGITFDDDGEFWMPYSDFVAIFTSLDICDVTPDVYSNIDDFLDDDLEVGNSMVPRGITPPPERKWKKYNWHGEWKRNVSSGGCRNFMETFSRNPQHVVLLSETEPGSEFCTMVVSLMQKNVREKKRYGIDNVPIGFAIYNLPPGIVPGRHLDKEFFTYHRSAARSPFFLNIREVTHHYRLPPGVYVVIPSTFRPYVEAEYLLRVFTAASQSKVRRLSNQFKYEDGSPSNKEVENVEEGSKEKEKSRCTIA